MAFIDLPLEQLKTFNPPRVEPDDFDAFWANTLADARRFPLDARFVPVSQEYGLKTVEAFDLTYNGFGGQPIKGWLMLPRERDSHRLPCVIEYIGYGGGRGYPINYLNWASCGYAHVIMDTRGQGSAGRRGDTADQEPAGSNPQHPGFMTRGVLNPDTYYYRRVFTDAVRIVEAAASHPAIDPNHIAATGVSQGGGIALAATGLTDQIKAIMPDVPFLCGYRRATELIDTDPYGEIARYCKIHRDKVEQVFHTLSYFDGVNFAARGESPALFSVALMDDICPPSTVFAAYNAYPGSKQIMIWPYNGHEGGAEDQALARVKFLGAQPGFQM